MPQTRSMKATTKRNRKEDMPSHDDSYPAKPEPKKRKSQKSKPKEKITKNCQLKKNMAKGGIERWFDEYRDSSLSDDAIIDPQGFEKLCMSIDLDMAGIQPLILLWLFHSTRLGFVTLSQWDTGIREMNVGNSSQLKTKVDQVTSNLTHDDKLYKDFYKGAFDFFRVEGQKSVPVADARTALEIIGKGNEIIALFIDFLKTEPVKVINRDQWSSLLELSRTLNKDMGNYDIDGAWPVLFDDFIEWGKKQQQQQQ